MPSVDRRGGGVGTHSQVNNFQLNFLLSINLIPPKGYIVARAGEGSPAMVVE